MKHTNKKAPDFSEAFAPPSGEYIMLKIKYLHPKCNISVILISAALLEKSVGFFRY
jgi:hypothetical protein